MEQRWQEEVMAEVSESFGSDFVTNPKVVKSWDSRYEILTKVKISCPSAFENDTFIKQSFSSSFGSMWSWKSEFDVRKHVRLRVESNFEVKN
jgi:hypothetical protein